MVAVGLAAVDAVTYLALQSSLSQQVNGQLSSGSSDAATILYNFAASGAVPRFGAFPSGVWGNLYSTHGTALSQGLQSVCYRPDNAPAPVLPKSVFNGANAAQQFTTTASSFPADVSRRCYSGAEYRVMYQLLEAPGQGATPGTPVVLVLAAPLNNVNTTLAQLRNLEVLVSAVVLGTVALLAWWTVKLGLMPLERIRHTAQAIARGDLSRRVDTSDTSTEVGQLSASLNEMLGQIEEAFGARAASEEKLRQFIADASHELRTPLSSIRGYAELFRHGAGSNPEDLSTAMTRIEAESARMTSLVDDMLLLARLDEGRPLQLRQVDLSELAVDAAADASVADRRHPIRVSAPAPVMAMGDEPRLRQVLNNLIRNAMVHTPAGTQVEVSVAQQGASAVLRVVDHGPGVPPELAGKIFERFVRAGSARGRESGGAGLGLAIVAAIVSAHRGSVRLEPTDGGGATFIVELPSPVNGPGTPTPDGNARSTSPRSTESPTVPEESPSRVRTGARR